MVSKYNKRRRRLLAEIWYIQMKTRNGTTSSYHSNLKPTQDKGIFFVWVMEFNIIFPWLCIVKVFSSLTWESYLLNAYLTIQDVYLAESRYLRFYMVQQLLSRVPRISLGNFYSFEKSFIPFKLYTALEKSSHKIVMLT